MFEIFSHLRLAVDEPTRARRAISKVRSVHVSSLRMGLDDTRAYLTDTMQRRLCLFGLYACIRKRIKPADPQLNRVEVRNLVVISNLKVFPLNRNLVSYTHGVA